MPQKKDAEESKCIAVNLPASLVIKLEAYKLKTGKSKNTILLEFIKTGLNSS